MDLHRPARLDALTGLRCFAAVNIVLFHFSNPQWFGILAPIVNAGYASVSFFILLSGFVLAYNYSQRAQAGELEKPRFWKARFTRLYPIYLLGLVMSVGMLAQERGVRSPKDFWMGVVLTPMLLQGWFPSIATFWNTPAWTMSAESFFYFIFPWLAAWKAPKQLWKLLAVMVGIWLLGLIPGVLYFATNPDGVVQPDRWTSAYWLNALKFTPIPHLMSFVFGVALAQLDWRLPRNGWLRYALGVFGFVSLFFILQLGPKVPYAIIHDGLLMPLFACVILCLAGRNPISIGLGWRPFVFVGEASYCLYLLHFNLWNLVHDTHVLDYLHLTFLDPWISYVLLVGLALVALHFVEKPAQKGLRLLMHAVMN